MDALTLGPNAKITGKLDVKSAETPAEQTSRLENESLEAAHRRRKEMVLLGVGVVVVAIALVICLYVTIGPGHSPENAKLAFNLLTTIISAAIGYQAGKATRSGSD